VCPSPRAILGRFATMSIPGVWVSALHNYPGPVDQLAFLSYMQQYIVGGGKMIRKPGKVLWG